MGPILFPLQMLEPPLEVFNKTSLLKQYSWVFFQNHFFLVAKPTDIVAYLFLIQKNDFLMPRSLDICLTIHVDYPEVLGWTEAH